MFVKRICAASLREAMHEVRETLGPNAVILSNRRIDQGIEIIAATDYREELLKKDPPAPAALPQKPPPEDETPDECPAETINSEPRPENARSFSDFFKAATNATDSTDSGTTETKPRIVWSQDPMLVDMQNQIAAMHNLLEQQLSGLAWGELGRRQPQRVELLERLMNFGLKTDLCLQLAEKVTSERDFERAWMLALEGLMQGLSTTNDDILTQGGIAALVGPTGVGKTTTVAKLAARYILRHGPRQVALITTDSYRIGAFEQLSTFGMILNVPVRLVKNHQELQSAIADFSSKSLILIDTAGMSQRDMRLSEQLTVLHCTPEIKSYVVLAANSQTAVLEEAIAAFKIPLAGCILTKLDEASRLGGALSVAHDSNLPLAYVSNGQRVPEELQPAQVQSLIHFGEQLANGNQRVTEDETLALTFGRKVANANF